MFSVNAIRTRTMLSSLYSGVNASEFIVVNQIQGNEFFLEIENVIVGSRPHLNQYNNSVHYNLGCKIHLWFVPHHYQL